MTLPFFSLGFALPDSMVSPGMAEGVSHPHTCHSCHSLLSLRSSAPSGGLLYDKKPARRTVPFKSASDPPRIYVLSLSHVLEVDFATESQRLCTALGCHNTTEFLLKSTRIIAYFEVKGKCVCGWGGSGGCQGWGENEYVCAYLSGK